MITHNIPLFYGRLKYCPQLWCYNSLSVAQTTPISNKKYPGFKGVCFDSLCPINNLSVIKGRVFLG